MIDLQPFFNEGLDYLRKWRVRYSPDEYPDKIILNTYYKQIAMFNMWPYIEKCFSKSIFSLFSKKFNNLQIAYNHVELEYKKYAERTLPAVKTQMKDAVLAKKIRLYQEDYTPLIHQLDNGNINGLIEIENQFMINFLANKMLLLWAGKGLLGVDKEKSFLEITGFKYEGFLKTVEHEIKDNRYGNTLTLFKAIAKNAVDNNPPHKFI